MPKPVNLEIHTYGDSAANETLVKVLNEEDDPRLVVYVSNMLGKLNKHLKNVEVKDNKDGSNNWLYKILKGEYLRHIEEGHYSNLYPTVKSYLSNSVVKTLRKKFQPYEKQGIRSRLRGDERADRDPSGEVGSN